MELTKAIEEIAGYDAEALEAAQKTYGDSWKKRGGVGAFMMLARKWDRIENQTKAFGYDIFDAIYDDPSPHGILDDISDLRCYLFLVEVEIRRELSCVPPTGPQGAAEAKKRRSDLTPLGTTTTGNSERAAEAT
tara:strand:- start:8248 stop:8649 length:402 start_codon:yes stop_codon:yes gene_type:complete